MRPILRQHFFHNGRGPELVKAHYGQTGSTLLAVDYLNPGVGAGDAMLRHLVFTASQSFMFTPEEVANYATRDVDWGATDQAAVVCLGRSAWLESFAPHHLAKCAHYRLMFYDEYLDIICEGIESNAGGYVVV